MWPRAGIGRQSGLKIQWDLFPWRFESARGYHLIENYYMTNKNILITGGLGFIGGNLSKALLNKNNVYCLDNLRSSSKKNLKELKKYKRFKFIDHDINKPISLNIKFDHIYHLACPASPPVYQKDPIFTLDTCYIGTKNILNIALKNECKIIFSSTSEIYGDPLVHPQKESYYGNVNTLGPRACYDEGKRISETLFYEYNKIYGLNIRIARIFNTYGPMMNKEDGRVVSQFINQALENRDISVYGDGKQTRSFCYIDDLVNGLIRLSNKKYIGPINLGNPKEYSIKDFAKIIIKLTSSKSKIKYYELPVNDPRKRKPNIGLALKHLNWKPKISLAKGLEKTVEYYKTSY